jgi:SAM-dependent methyltransferase
MYLSHVEKQMKTLREAGSADENLWEREWITIGTLLRLIDRDLGQVSSVADVGCGGRELELGARARSISYRGFDIDDGNFEFDPLPADDSTFDLVVALALVEHLHNPDNFIREALRVLRPGGVLVVSTPNWHYASRHFYDNPAHVQPYTPVSLSTLMSAYALESVATFPGLRAKTGRAYLGKHRFLRAALRPARGAVPWLPRFLTGRATSFFTLGVKPF